MYLLSLIISFAYKLSALPSAKCEALAFACDTAGIVDSLVFSSLVFSSALLGFCGLEFDTHPIFIPPYYKLY